MENKEAEDLCISASNIMRKANLQKAVAVIIILHKRYW
jgi:hypothetical protein